MRKKDDGLKEEIMRQARAIISKEGPEGINMRGIAAGAGIATGTLYNYFASKEEILLALTQDYWEKTLADLKCQIGGEGFICQLEELYVLLRKGLKTAGMLMGSRKKVEVTGRERMKSMQLVLGELVMELLEKDEAICTKEGVWSQSFTREGYAAFVTENIIFLLRSGQGDLSLFLEIVRRTLKCE